MYVCYVKLLRYILCECECVCVFDGIILHLSFRLRCLVFLHLPLLVDLSVPYSHSFTIQHYYYCYDSVCVLHIRQCLPSNREEHEEIVFILAASMSRHAFYARLINVWRVFTKISSNSLQVNSEYESFWSMLLLLFESKLYIYPSISI